MSPYSDMNSQAEQCDTVWKALSDSTRRDILDLLAERPLSTGEIASRFEDTLCRTAVMKHLEILVDANLVVVRREGRNRWNYLNPLPIQHVCDRWVSRHVAQIASAVSRLKELTEERFVSAVTSEKCSTARSGAEKH